MSKETENKELSKDKALHIAEVVCSSCGKDIKPDDDKHCFWYEDIEDGINPECLDCYLERESICRDFGF
mgnify:CR=1 FL=1